MPAPRLDVDDLAVVREPDARPRHADATRSAAVELSKWLVGGTPAPTTIAPLSFCRPVLLKIGRSKFSLPLPAASTTVMPLAVAAAIAEKMSSQYCIATYFPLGPVACNSIRITSPAFKAAAALVIAPAALKTPLMTAEWTTAFASWLMPTVPLTSGIEIISPSTAVP